MAPKLAALFVTKHPKKPKKTDYKDYTLANVFSEHNTCKIRCTLKLYMWNEMIDHIN